MTTPADFIAFFESIPDEQWCVGAQESFDYGCALHLCYLRGNGGEDAVALMSLLNRQAAKINDGLDPRYQQPTPRARIVAALMDVK